MKACELLQKKKDVFSNIKAILVDEVRSIESYNEFNVLTNNIIIVSRHQCGPI